jgi:hypothetical protein
LPLFGGEISQFSERFSRPYADADRNAGGQDDGLSDLMAVSNRSLWQTPVKSRNASSTEYVSRLGANSSKVDINLDDISAFMWN